MGHFYRLHLKLCVILILQFPSSNADPKDRQANGTTAAEPAIQNSRDLTPAQNTKKKLSSQDYFGSLVSLNDITDNVNEKKWSDDAYAINVE